MAPVQTPTAERETVQGQRVGSTRFVVMRSPVLMEDEGRDFLIKVYTSRAKAQEWIDAQKDEYFKPRDYYILEEPR